MLECTRVALKQENLACSKLPWEQAPFPPIYFCEVDSDGKYFKFSFLSENSLMALKLQELLKYGFPILIWSSFYSFEHAHYQ